MSRLSAIAWKRGHAIDNGGLLVPVEDPVFGFEGFTVSVAAEGFVPPPALAGRSQADGPVVLPNRAVDQGRTRYVGAASLS